MYVRKDNYLTYNGESHKLVDDKDKSITWKDGSKSPYGQRITLFDRLNLISFLECGEHCLYTFFSLNGRSKENIKTNKTTPASSQTR